MTVAPGPAVRQLLTRGLAQQHQVGAVEHFPGDGLAGFQIESRSQGQGDVGIDLHGATVAADALQTSGVVIFHR